MSDCGKFWLLCAAALLALVALLRKRDSEVRSGQELFAITCLAVVAAISYCRGMIDLLLD